MFESLHTATTFGPAVVALIGRQRRIIEDEGRMAATQAQGLGAHPSKICRLIVASDETRTGFQQLKLPDFQELCYADGVLLTEIGSAVAGQSGDCPFVILHNLQSDRMAIFHAGRPALTPFCKLDSPHCDFTIVETALSQLCGAGSRESVQALIIGNICGSCFKHDQPEARAKATWFSPLGDHVFADVESLSLDLEAVIRHRLTHQGVAESNIRHVGPCTFETPSLASHRRGDTDVRNTLIVVKRT